MIGSINTDKYQKWTIILSIIQLIFIAIALIIEQPTAMLIPAIIAFGVLIMMKVRWIYFLFALVIPFSIEVELPGGLGTDLPSEPVMWILTGVGLLYLVSRPLVVTDVRWKHPVSLLIIAHIMWIGLTAYLSQDVVISTKFFLAKVWYVIPFYFLFLLIHDNQGRLQGFFKVLITAMVVSILIVIVRHAGYGFSFKSINEAVHPIFRNHVNYACMLVALIPYVWANLRISKSMVWAAGLFLFLLAIYLSYTRAAMVALVIGVGAYMIIRWRLARPAIIITVLSVVLVIPYLLNDNKYLDYAPEYERAIAHYKFDNLIEATYKFEDISTMERLYRWVAGKEMIAERPFFGFGPGTFYSYYQDYSVAEFQTYVSNNPERSGIHNYYLMTFVEQGFLGFLIFALFIIAGIIYGEKAYHQAVDNHRKYFNMAATVSLIMISAILLINDLVEADKVGPFLFIAMAIIVGNHIKISFPSNH
ncbi:MAG: O-antigen ligase family protein [Saprospiraceae bacterium]|nr:O-antigen ligase family protein [Saprospiraceae bacterium]